MEISKCYASSARCLAASLNDTALRGYGVCLSGFGAPGVSLLRRSAVVGPAPFTAWLIFNWPTFTAAMLRKLGNATVECIALPGELKDHDSFNRTDNWNGINFINLGDLIIIRSSKLELNLNQSSKRQFARLCLDEVINFLAKLETIVIVSKEFSRPCISLSVSLYHLEARSAVIKIVPPFHRLVTSGQTSFQYRSYTTFD